MADAGTVVVNLDANSVKLQREMDKADRATRRATKRMRQRTVREFKAMGRQAALFGAAVAGAMVVATRASLQLADSIGKTADKVGVSTDALQELRFAAEQTGVAQNALDMGIQRFSRRVGEAVRGQGELKDTLKEYNIELRNADGSTRSVEAILRDYADAVKNAESEQEQLRLAFKGFDSEGAALVNLLRGGAAAVDDFASKAQQLGIVMDEQLIRQAEEANDKLNVLSQVIRVQVASALVALSPAIIAVSEQFTDMARSVSDAGEESEGSAEKIVNAVAFIMNAVAGVQRTFAIWGRSLTLLFASIELGALQLSNTIVNGPGAAIDWLLRKADQIPGVEIDFQFGPAFPQVQRRMDIVTGIIREGVSDIQDILMEPLPGDDLIERFERNMAERARNIAAPPAPAPPPVAPPGTVGTDGAAPVDEEAMARAQRAAQIFQDTRTDFERYAEQLNEAFSLFQEGLIDEETYFRWVDQIEEGMIRIEDTAEETTEQISVFWEQAARNMQDALADFIFDPFQDGLDGMLAGFADMMRRMIAEAAAAQIFEQMGGIEGVGATLGGLFGGGRASGGPTSPGKAYLVGEEGPELIVPGRANVIPNHALVGGQQVFQTIVQAPQGRISRESEGRARAMQMAQASEYQRRNA